MLRLSVHFILTVISFDNRGTVNHQSHFQAKGKWFGSRQRENLQMVDKRAMWTSKLTSETLLTSLTPV